jgi:cell division protein FtsI/penicillin-binding protein 2
MFEKLQHKRLVLPAVLLVALLGCLAYRLFDLQILRHSQLSALARQNTRRETYFQPRRGDILDAKGSLLATSLFAKSVYADPSLIVNRQAEVARVLAPLLQMEEADLVRRLAHVRVNSKGETVTNTYVLLKQPVAPEIWPQIQAAMTNLTFGIDEKKLRRSERNFFRNLRQKAVYSQDYPVRVYPNHMLAAHVLGFAQTEEREVDNHLRNDIGGREGIELTLDSKLRGVPGWRVTEKDREGREMVSARQQDVESRDGLNVVLTIDSVVQNIVETALAEAMQKHTPVSITGIVVRPRTGEILAMATLPNFDPNIAGRAVPEARKNRVITDVVEPGSTFKIVVVSGALNDATVNLNDQFDCEHGHFSYAGKVLHDHESLGTESVKSIITKSSNIGAAKIGIKMGAGRLYDYISAFGFGERTGLPLPGEVRGISLPVKKWSKVSVAQIPMGQGIAVTRLQMLMAMCTIANKGVRMRPMLVDHLEDGAGEVVVKYSPQPVARVVSESTARQMVEALKTVVSHEGTAEKAALKHYTVAGKTGTAQKAEGGVYVHGKFVSSFIGFFPADNPEVCISVVLDEPKDGHYGGLVAAPAFAQIAERLASYLHVPSDIDAPGKPGGLADGGEHGPKASIAP